MEPNTIPAVAAASQQRPKPKLVERFAERFNVDPKDLLHTLKATAFKQRDPGKVVSTEQLMALLIVAEQYGLNPWTKEIFAFEDKIGIIPVVSVDGWARIINEHPAFDGIEFEYSEKRITMPDGKECPEWCEAVIYRKDRSRPTRVREWLAEVYVPKRNGYVGPWQTHTARMLRHKALIQGGRVAFGFAGIHDEDEANRILDARLQPDNTYRVTDASNTSELQRQLEQQSSGLNPAIKPAAEPVVVGPITDATFTDLPAGAEQGTTNPED